MAQPFLDLGDIGLVRQGIRRRRGPQRMNPKSTGVRERQRDAFGGEDAARTGSLGQAPPADMSLQHKIDFRLPAGACGAEFLKHDWIKPQRYLFLT